MRIAFIGAALLTVFVRADAAMAQTAQERIDAATAHAREAGIPVTLLERKVAEGKARGFRWTGLPRLSSGARRRSRERARLLRGRPDVGAADLSVGADAIETGVSAAVLKAIADSAPRDRRVVADCGVDRAHTRGAAFRKRRSIG